EAAVELRPGRRHERVRQGVGRDAHLLLHRRADAEGRARNHAQVPDRLHPRPRLKARQPERDVHEPVRAEGGHAQGPACEALILPRPLEVHGGSAALACVWLALAGTTWSLGAATALLGLGHLSLALGVQAVVARESPEDRHDRDFALLTAGVAAGQLLGPLAGGILLGSAGRAELVGATGRTLLVAAGVAGVATGLAFAAERLPAPPRPEADEPATWLRSILSLPGVRAGLFAGIAVLAAADVFTAYMPVLGEQKHIAPSAIGVLLALRAGASFFGRLGLTRLVALLGRARLIAVSALVAAAGFAAMTTTSRVV